MPRIVHIAIKVDDLEKATKFEEVFGFRQTSTGYARGHVSRHLTVQREPAQVHVRAAHGFHSPWLDAPNQAAGHCCGRMVSVICAGEERCVWQVPARRCKRRVGALTISKILTGYGTPTLSLGWNGTMAVTRTKEEEFRRLAQECRATAQTLSTELARAEMLAMAAVCGGSLWHRCFGSRGGGQIDDEIKLSGLIDRAVDWN
jgi:hypothetical protein